MVATRPRSLFLIAALAVGAVFQFSLLGTMPIGDYAAASWMLPLSLLGALTLFGLCGVAIALGVRTSKSAVSTITTVGATVSPKDQLGLVVHER